MRKFSIIVCITWLVVLIRFSPYSNMFDNSSLRTSYPIVTLYIAVILSILWCGIYHFIESIRNNFLDK